MSKRFILFSVCALMAWNAVGITGESQTEIQTFENYSRVTIPVLNGATFKSRTMDGNSTEVILQIENTPTSGLSKLSEVKDHRVKGLRAVSSGELRLLLAQASMEYFAYMQPSPPVLVVDIWSKKTPTVETKTYKKTPQRALASLPKLEKKTLVRAVDFLNTTTGIFQKFPQPMPPYTHKGKRFQIPFEDNLDELWSWQKPEKNEAGGGNFSFAQKLFQEKKYGLCIRTIELTERDFPKNKFIAEMQLLKAMAYKKLGDHTKQEALWQKAEEIYLDLVNRRGDDGKALPFQLHLKLYFATKAFKAKQWIDSIEQFEAIAKLLPESDPDFAPLQMALAESYIAVDQYRRAERIYRFLAQEYAAKQIAKEAYYRRAAMLSMEKNYERAAEVTEEALKEYPEYRTTRTEAHFNLGEAYFGLGNYKQAWKHFNEFVKRHPSQTLAGLAYVRLGEISEMDRKSLVDAKRFYLEAKDRFPYSLGAKIGALRIARLNLEEEKDLSYPIRQIQEMLGEEGLFPETKKMARAVLADYLLKDGQNKEASAIALSSMSEVSGEAEYARFRLLYVRSLVQQLQIFVKNGEYSQGLALYEEQKKWFAMGGSVVFKHLADLYRGLGLFDSSNKYMQMYSAEKRKEQGGRALASTGEDQGLRLIKAKNSYAQGKYAESLNYIADLNPSADVLKIRAGSNAKLGRWKEAYSDAAKGIAAFASIKEKVDPAAFDDTIIELTDIVLDRSEKERNYSEREETLQRSMNMLNKKHERFQFLHADALWYQKRHEQAAKAYKELIIAYPKSDRVSRAKYNLAMSEIALGKRQDAVKTLTELRDSSQNVWSKSAKQELELLEWEKKYSSVLRSLPPSGLGIVN